MVVALALVASVATLALVVAVAEMALVASVAEMALVVVVDEMALVVVVNELVAYVMYNDRSVVAAGAKSSSLNVICCSLECCEARWRISQLVPTNLPQLAILFCRPRISTWKH